MRAAKLVLDHHDLICFGLLRNQKIAAVLDLRLKLTGKV